MQGPYNPLYSVFMFGHKPAAYMQAALSVHCVLGLQRGCTVLQWAVDVYTILNVLVSNREFMVSFPFKVCFIKSQHPSS